MFSIYNIKPLNYYSKVHSKCFVFSEMFYGLELCLNGIYHLSQQCLFEAKCIGGECMLRLIYPQHN